MYIRCLCRRTISGFFARDGSRLEYEGALTLEIEAYAFEDVRFNNTWKRDVVWRIRLKGRCKEAVYRFIFQ